MTRDEKKVMIASHALQVLRRLYAQFLEVMPFFDAKNYGGTHAFPKVEPYARAYQSTFEQWLREAMKDGIEKSVVLMQATRQAEACPDAAVWIYGAMMEPKHFGARLSLFNNWATITTPPDELENLKDPVIGMTASITLEYEGNRIQNIIMSAIAPEIEKLKESVISKTQALGMAAIVIEGVHEVIKTAIISDREPKAVKLWPLLENLRPQLDGPSAEQHALSEAVVSAVSPIMYTRANQFEKGVWQIYDMAKKEEASVRSVPVANFPD